MIGVDLQGLTFNTDLGCQLSKPNMLQDGYKLSSSLDMYRSWSSSFLVVLHNYALVLAYDMDYARQDWILWRYLESLKASHYSLLFLDWSRFVTLYSILNCLLLRVRWHLTYFLPTGWQWFVCSRVALGLPFSQRLLYVVQGFWSRIWVRVYSSLWLPKKLRIVDNGPSDVVWERWATQVSSK